MKQYKVTCIDNSGVELNLTKGSTYIATRVDDARFELKDKFGWFYTSRFTLLEETEVTFFTRHIMPNRGTAESLIQAFEKEFTDYHLLVIENDGKLELHSKEMLGIAGQSFVKGFLAGIP